MQGFAAQRNLHAATRFHFQTLYRGRLLLRLSTSPSLDASQRLALVSNCSLPVHSRAGQRAPSRFHRCAPLRFAKQKNAPVSGGVFQSRHDLVLQYYCTKPIFFI